MDTDREKGDLTTEAQTGMTQAQVKECWQSVDAGREKEPALPKSLWWAYGLANTLISDF